MARRGANIYKRKDRRWEGRYIKGRRPDGKPIYGYVYASKYKECKEKLDLARSQCRYGQNMVKTYGTGTVADFMGFWLHNIVQPNVKASTFSNYASMQDKWIIPFLGDKKLSKVEKEDVQSFVSSLSEKGLAAGTVRNIYRVLHGTIEKAREYGYVYRNPCEDIHLPEPEKKEARVLTMQEQEQLEDAAKEDKNGFAILLALYTGLRVGELCALPWKNVDLDNGLLYVSGTIQRIQCYDPDAATKTKLLAGSAKSIRSVRTIPLPDCILDLFKEHRNISTGEYVFEYNGHPLEPRTMQYRFKALQEKAGLEDVNFHALRHTFATRCMELAMDVKTLSELMGHSSAKMTLDRYGHSQLKHKRAAMQTLNQLFVKIS